MDLERSKLSVFEGEIRSINRPVLRGAAIPDGLGFLALDPRRASPMLSGAVAGAIRAHELYGIGLREILVI